MTPNPLVSLGCSRSREEFLERLVSTVQRGRHVTLLQVGSMVMPSRIRALRPGSKGGDKRRRYGDPRAYRCNSPGGRARAMNCLWPIFLTRFIMVCIC